MATTAHVKGGHARGGVYTWMVHYRRARRTRDAWCTPRTMSAARTNTIPACSTTIPSARPPWQPRVCAGRLPSGPLGRPGRRLPGCSRCRAWSNPGLSPAPHRSAGRRVRPRIPLRAAPCRWRQVRGIGWGTSPLRCSAPASTRGRGIVRCPLAAWIPLAHRPRGLLGSTPGQSQCPRPPGGGSLRGFGVPAP